MSAVILVAAFTISAPSGSSYTSPSRAADKLEDRVQTGTLLISKGDCLAVKVFTCEPYTHVAAVVKRNGRVYVYESENGHGVRRLDLEDYLDKERPNVIYVLNPKRPFSRKRAKVFRKYLKSQLGRPYGVKHHLTGKRADGVHCSEYVTDALMRCDVIHANRPPRVSPGSLAKGVLQSNLYEAETRVTLKPKALHRPVARNRCDRLWIDTKLCTIRFCLKMRRWFVCR